MYRMLIRVGDCGFDFLELQGYCLLALLACRIGDVANMATKVS